MSRNQQAAETLVHDIAHELARHRRTEDRDSLPTELSGSLMACVRRFVCAGEPVHMVLPAFPAKSPSLRKVLGGLPDLADSLSLQALEHLCARIATVYPVGVRLTICSDGHVFGPAIRVRDNVIDQYRAAIQELIATRRLEHLDTFCLLDCPSLVAGDASPEQRRSALLAQHGRALDEVRSGLLRSEAGLQQLRGIIRFMAEDDWRENDERSATQIQREAKQRAYAVVQGSQAWADLLKAVFPDAVRLSIHPQAADSDRLGIHMLPTADAWLTPWHAVAVDLGGRTILMKRHQAESQGATLVQVDGRPSHYCAWPDGRRRTLHDHAFA